MSERTTDQVASDIANLTNQVKNLQEEVVEASSRGDDETVSTNLLRLARVNAALGRQAAYAKYIARNAERAAKRRRAEITLELSKSQAVNKSEKEAEIAVAEDFSVASQAQLLADESDDLTYRTDTFLKMGQSRLSLLKADKHNG